MLTVQEGTGTGYGPTIQMCDLELQITNTIVGWTVVPGVQGPPCRAVPRAVPGMLWI